MAPLSRVFQATATPGSQRTTVELVGQTTALRRLIPSTVAPTPGVPRPIMDPRRLWALWRPVIWALDRASGVVDDHRVSTLLATGAQAVRENASFRATAREVRRERRRRPGALDGVPTVVVTALSERAWRWRRLPGSWYRQQARMAGDLAARHLIIHPSGHLVMNDHPREVAEIVAELL